MPLWQRQEIQTLLREMKNAEIAEIFTDIGQILRNRKDSIFKIRAYEKVAAEIKTTDLNLEQLVKENRLREISGVGDAIEKKITELVNTGRLEFYERLKAETAGEQNG